jgi:hypothetical protein
MSMTTPVSARDRGQVLVVFALWLLVLIGAAALATDYGYWLNERRTLQNAADTAAQAGISELLERPITPAKQDAATEHAVLYLDEQLGMGLKSNGQVNCAAAAASDPLGDGFGPEDCLNYTGPDRILIRTPVDAGMGCSGAAWGTRAIRVTIVHGSTRFFSRIYSLDNPDVSVCATSAIFGGSLAIAVLKPNTGVQPNNANLTMKLAGSDTFIRVYGGDVAINAMFSAAGAPPPQAPNEPAYIKFMTAVGLGISDNRMYATIENPSPITWSIDAKQIRTEGLMSAESDDPYHAPLHLPAYVPIPGWGNALYAALDDDAVAPITLGAADAATGTCTDPVTGLPGVDEGKYDLIGVGTGARRWLCPGVFHLVSRSGQEGLQLASNAIIAGQGVTLVLDDDSELRVDSGGVLLLNSAAAGGTETPAPWRTGDVRHDVPLTIWIEPVAGCDPLLPACSDSTSSTVFDLSGGAGLDVRGIIYGPTDKMKISGNDQHHGSGEIWAWTLEYLGNSQLDQVYEGGDDGWPLLVE